MCRGDFMHYSMPGYGMTFFFKSFNRHISLDLIIYSLVCIKTTQKYTLPFTPASSLIPQIPAN